MAKWKLEDSFEPDFIKKGYAEWCEWFSRHSRLFYRHQTMYHFELLFNRFIRENDLSEYQESWYENDFYKWEQYQDENGYSENVIKTEGHRKNIFEYLRPYLVYKKPKSNKEIASELTNMLLTSKPDPTLLVHSITRLWFNNIVDNTPEKQMELKKINYSKEYLQTKHWRKIRALQVFIHRGKCSNKGCHHTLNETFLGQWIQDLHVHHISYDNRGNERFEDVCLLCKYCHDEITKNPDSDVVSATNTFIVF